jgi:eukaryotic-like serine/threonine-protein kinase
MTMSVLPGEKGNAQYSNLRFLKHGGMGSIYLAADTFSGNDVAVKTFYYGEFSEPSGCYFYCIMELATAGNLRKLLETTVSFLSIQQCLFYFTNVQYGLQEAHKNIIHRDLKPENILLESNGELKICDFGISKFVDNVTRTWTNKGSGTFSYMAPECWLWEANTVQMDIYSVGIIFYEMLSLKLPFSGPNYTDFREQHLFEHMPDIRSVRPDVPIVISHMIRKMTNKKANDRFDSVDSILNLVTKEKQETNAVSDIQSICIIAQLPCNHFIINCSQRYGIGSSKLC